MLCETVAREFPDYVAGDEGNVGCIATSKGLNGAEVAATLLHESMHGLFYAYASLEVGSQRATRSAHTPRTDRTSARCVNLPLRRRF